jgi:hypothetical protein
MCPSLLGSHNQSSQRVWHLAAVAVIDGWFELALL